MNTETKHTPGRLRAANKDGIDGWSGIYKDSSDGSELIADAALPDDAARLVHCWNAHDDMAKELAQLRADKAELVSGIQKLLNNFVTAEAYPEFIANRNNYRFVDMASAETVARAIIAKHTKV